MGWVDRRISHTTIIADGLGSSCSKWPNSDKGPTTAIDLGEKIRAFMCGAVVPWSQGRHSGVHCWGLGDGRIISGVVLYVFY